MPPGGKRAGAGRKKNQAEQPAPKKDLASKILDGLGKPNGHEPDCKCEGGKCPHLCLCEECLWKRDCERDGQGGQWARDRLWSRRNGNPVTTVNHLHDKPLEMNVNVKLSEIIRQVRERKREYERKR